YSSSLQGASGSPHSHICARSFVRRVGERPRRTARHHQEPAGQRPQGAASAARDEDAMSNRSHHDLLQSDHLSDLLPAFVNGTLDQETRERVHTHLGSCEICRDELAEWEDIASSTRTFATTLRTPATHGRTGVRSFSATSELHSGQDRDALAHATGRRPASNRTLRAAQENTAMQPAL